MVNQRSTTLFQTFFLALIACVCSEYDVPTKKAMPPKMNPIPTLPIVTERVFLEISIDGENIGKIVFGLFGEVAPKAVHNFSSLCKCNLERKASRTGKDLCYKKSQIHRVIPNFIIQGGDYTNGDGTGGETVFNGGLPFEDESFAVKHNRKYLLSMANDGKGKPNTNRSQWFINTVKTQWLDGKNIIFGMVLSGKDVIKSIEKKGTNGGTPNALIIIEDSGSMPSQPEDSIPTMVSQPLTA